MDQKPKHAEVKSVSRKKREHTDKEINALILENQESEKNGSPLLMCVVTCTSAK